MKHKPFSVISTLFFWISSIQQSPISVHCCLHAEGQGYDREGRGMCGNNTEDIKVDT